MDNLFEARRRQVAQVLASADTRRAVGADRYTRQQSNFEWLMHKLSVPEEILVKAIGSLTTDNSKFHFGVGGETFENQVGFADLFRESGMGPGTAAAFGLLAAIANPLDPLNKLKILQTTKVGKAAEGIARAGKLIEEAGKLPRISKAGIIDEIARLKKVIGTKAIKPENVRRAEQSLARHEKSLTQVDELNSLISELEARGTTRRDLRLGQTTFDQVRMGQRHLIGFSSPFKLDQLSMLGFSRGVVDEASVATVMPAKFQAAVVKAATKVGGAVKKPIMDAAYKVAEYAGIPTAKSAKAKQVAAAVKELMRLDRAAKTGDQLDLESLYRNFLKDFENEEDAVDVLLQALQQTEFKNLGAKEVAIRELERAAKKFKFLGGKGVSIGPGKGLTADEKIQITASGVDDAEIPIAIGQFKSGTVDSIRVGVHGQHEAKITGRYIVVKVGDAKTAERAVDELDGIYGNRVWARHTESDGSTYLITKRFPSAQRIKNIDDLLPEHVEHLQRIAAQLSRKKQTLVGLTHKDILVAPSGAVQIINPSVIDTAKSQTEAVLNSRIAIEGMLNSIHYPSGSVRELHWLKNATTANRVPRGVDGLSFRRMQAPSNFSSEVLDHNAHDLLEEAANVEGFRDVVRASYDEISPRQLAEAIGDPRDFERANQIEFYREKIRAAIANGEPVMIEPIAVVRDDYGLHIASDGGRARLTAAILEGYDTVPVYIKNLIGDTIDVTKGHYSGATWRLGQIWDPVEDSSAAHLRQSTQAVVADNYSLLRSNGEVVRLNEGSITLDGEFEAMFEKAVARGMRGDVRTARLHTVNTYLTEKYGSVRNGLLHFAHIAEKTQDPKALVEALNKLLTVEGKQGIGLSNAFEALSLDKKLVERLQASAIRSLDDLAAKGFLTRETIDAMDLRRIKLATDRSDLVVRVMNDPHTMSIISNNDTTVKLKKVAESFLNKTVTAADVEPYGRIRLVGANADQSLEVRDFVEGTHPRLQEAMEGTRVFSIAKEQGKALERTKGVLVADGSNTAHVREALKQKGMHAGILLKEKDMPIRGQQGRFSAVARERQVIRPEYPFFITRSGAVAIGTRQRSVKDLLNAVFEEGPAYFQEIGVITSGRIVMSNTFGEVIEKIGKGEIRALTARLKDVAQKFTDLGLSRSTVLQVHMPFDDAVWRSIYGERVTLGDILDDGFKLNIPDELLNHTPDIRVAAPGKFSITEPQGVVAIERTRLANKRLNDLVRALEDTNDELFIRAAKEGLPISYHESYIGRHLTDAAREGLNEAFLKFPGKSSRTFKHLESVLKGRVLTDLTTQEINSIIKRLQKEGYGSVEQLISDVVAEYRNGYKIAPSAERAGRLVAIAKALPEGVSFFHTDPIWATHLSQVKTQTAITRSQIVKTLKDLNVAVWHGTPKELEALRITRNQTLVKWEREYAQVEEEISKTRALLQKAEASGDVAKGDVQELTRKIDELVHRQAVLDGKKADALAKAGPGKVMDQMVDPESSEIWIKGEDLQRFINEGKVNADEVIGDPSDAFVRVPVAKYASMLEDAGSEVFLFPKEVAGAVQRYFGATTREGASKFLKLWDTVHNAWRQWTLFPIPAYHVRNGVSNLFMMWLGGVSSPSVHKQSMAIMGLIGRYRSGKMAKSDLLEALGSVSFASAGGEVVDGLTLYSEFVKRGGLSGGLHFNEFTSFGTLARASEFERLSVRAGLRPSSELTGSWLFDNAALRAGIKVGSGLENRARLAVFIDAFTKGRVEVQGGKTLTGFDAAAMHMKRVLYDYGDLNAFERSWLRRVLPFYSWARHNTPRMLVTLATDPVKHYRMYQYFNDLERGITNGADRETSLPQWVRDRYGLVVSKTSTGEWLVKAGDGFLPYFDAYKVLAGHGIGEMIMDGMTPFIKVPIEQLTNYSLFMKGKIEQVAGQRAKSQTLGALGFTRRMSVEGPLGVLNIALNESLFKTFFRVGGEFTKLLDQLGDDKYPVSDRVRLSAWAMTLGRAYAIDPVRARNSIYKDWHKRRSQLVGIRNRAKAEGDVKSVEDADRMLTWLTLQYPGN